MACHSLNIITRTGLVVSLSLNVNPLISLIPPNSLKFQTFTRCGAIVLSCIANLNQRNMAKQSLTPLRLIARMNISLNNCSCELVNLTGTVGKVELISTFTTAACESRNVSDK